MATQLQIRRGTTAQMNAFTGAEGELAVNTTTDTLHIHDGATAGGKALARADGSNIATYAGSFTTISASGAITGNVTGNLTGSVLTAAQTNITSVGTLSTLAVSGAFTNGSTLVSTGKITADAGIDIDNINIDGTTIALSSGNLTLDVAGETTVDSGSSGILNLKHSGTLYGTVYQDSNHLHIKSQISDGDLKLQGVDGGSLVTALSLDMSAAGAATFNSKVTSTGFIASSLLNSANDSLTLVGGGSATNNGANLTLYGGSASSNAGDFRFRNGTAVTATITAEGNAGIGTSVPTQSDSNSHFLYGGGSNGFNLSATEGPIALSSNVTVNSGSKYVFNGFASKNYQLDGAHVWETAASGTAGNAISFTERMRISAAGQVTTPNQPMFHAKASANQTIGNDVKVTFNQTDINVGNHYSSSNKRFTAPLSGKYFFSFAASINNMSSTGAFLAVYFVKNNVGTGHRFRTRAENVGSKWTGITGTAILNLSTGDYIEVNAYNESGTFMLAGNETNFSGYLIG